MYFPVLLKFTLPVTLTFEVISPSSGSIALYPCFKSICCPILVDTDFGIVNVGNLAIIISSAFFKSSSNNLAAGCSLTSSLRACTFSKVLYFSLTSVLVLSVNKSLFTLSAKVSSL